MVLTGLATPGRAEVDTNGQLISYSAPVSYALEGKVVDENGGPVAGADVWVTMAMPVPGGVVPAPVVPPGADPLTAVPISTLPGGEFSQRSMIFGKPARDCFSARTGADGHFRIANFPANTQANLTAHKSGMAMIQPANAGGGMLRVRGFGFGIPSSVDAPPPYMLRPEREPGRRLLAARPHALRFRPIVHRTGPDGGGKHRRQGDCGRNRRPLAGVKVIPLTVGKGLSGLQMPETVLSGAEGSFRIVDVVPGGVNIAPFFLAARPRIGGRRM